MYKIFLMLFLAVSFAGCSLQPSRPVVVAKVCDDESGGWNCSNVSVTKPLNGTVIVENKQPASPDFQVPCIYPGRLVQVDTIDENSAKKQKWVCAYPPAKQVQQPAYYPGTSTTGYYGVTQWYTPIGAGYHRVGW